jgi:hypothetical protein
LLDDADGAVYRLGQAQRLGEVVERAEGDDAQWMLGFDQPAHHPSNGAVTARNDNLRGWRDELFDVHAGIEFDDQAFLKRLADLRLRDGRHRACLCADDHQACSPGDLELGRYVELLIKRTHRAQAKE